MAEQYINIYPQTTSEPIYTRPIDWITIPSIGVSEQVIYMLYAVYDGASNLMAFDINGNFTVDWGDGTITNYTSGTAEHEYDYANVSNLSTRGYRQALIKITPQVGQNLTLLNVQRKHSKVVGTNIRGVNLLDIVVSMPNATGINIFIGFRSGFTRVLLDMCERYWIVNGGTTTSYILLAYQQVGIQQLIINNTSSVTNMQQMCLQTRNIVDVQLGNTSNVTTFLAAFQDCFNLKGVTQLDLSSCTTATSIFQNCRKLESVEVINSILLTNLVDSFFIGSGLIEIPATFNTSTFTTIRQMFRTSTAYRGANNLNLNSCTNMQLAFYDSNLQEFVNSTTGNVQNASFAFTLCSNLKKVVMNCTSVTNTTSMLSSCASLEYLELNGLKISFSVANANLDGVSIDRLANSVADLTALPGATVTLTGNYGTATFNSALWTAKNWTVVT